MSVDKHQHVVNGIGVGILPEEVQACRNIGKVRPSTTKGHKNYPKWYLMPTRVS